MQRNNKHRSSLSRIPTLQFFALLTLTSCAPHQIAQSAASTTPDMRYPSGLVYLDSIDARIELSPTSNLATQRTTLHLSLDVLKLAEFNPRFYTIRANSVLANGLDATIITQPIMNPLALRNYVKPEQIALSLITARDKVTTTRSVGTRITNGAVTPEKLTISGDVILASPEAVVSEIYRFDEGTHAYQIAPNLVARYVRDESNYTQTITVEYDTVDLAFENIPLKIRYIDSTGVDLTGTSNVYPTTPNTGTICMSYIHTSNPQFTPAKKAPAGVRIERASRLIWTEIPFEIEFDARGDTYQRLKISMPDDTSE